MRTVTAREVHKQLGEVLDQSQHEPVLVTKNGRPYSIIHSARNFDAKAITNDRAAKVEALIALAKASSAQAAENGLTPEIAQSIIDGE